MKRTSLYFLFSCLFAVTSTALYAQTGTYSASGNVVDQDGNVLSGITVSLETQTFPPTLIKTTTTRADGTYTLTDISPGYYNVEAKIDADKPKTVVGLHLFNSDVALSTLVLRQSDIIKKFAIALTSGGAPTTTYNNGVKYGQATITNLTYLAHNFAISNDIANNRQGDPNKTGELMLYTAGARRYTQSSDPDKAKVAADAGIPYEVTPGHNLSLGYTWNKNGYTFRVETNAQWDDASENYSYIVKRQGNPSPPQDPTGITYYQVRGVKNKQPDGKMLVDIEDMHTVIFMDRMPNYPATDVDATIVATWKVDKDPFNPRYNQYFYQMFKWEKTGEEIDAVSGATVQGIMPFAIDADPQESTMGAYGVGGVDNNGNLIVGEQEGWRNACLSNGESQYAANANVLFNQQGAKLIWDSPNVKNPMGGEILRVDHPFSIKANYMNPSIDLNLYANADNGFIAFLNGQYIGCSNSFLDERGEERFGTFDFLDEEKVVKAMIDNVGRTFGNPPLEGVDWNKVMKKKVVARLFNMAAAQMKNENGNDILDADGNPLHQMNNVLTIYAVNARHIKDEFSENGAGYISNYIADGNSMNNPAFLAYSLIGEIDTDMGHILVAEPTSIISYQGGTSRSNDAFPRPRFRYFKLAYDITEDRVFHEYEISQTQIEQNKWMIGVDDNGVINMEPYSPFHPTDPSESNPKYPQLIYPDAPFRAFFYEGQVVLNGLTQLPVGVYRIRTIWDDAVKKITIDGQELVVGTTELNPVYSVVYPPPFIEVRPLSITAEKTTVDHICKNISEVPDDLNNSVYFVLPPDEARPEAIHFTGAYGLELPINLWYPQTAEENKKMLFRPEIIFDNLLDDEKIQIEEVLSKDNTFAGYGRPTCFFAEMVNYLNGNVVIRPADVQSDAPDTWITVVLPYKGRFTRIKIVHFPQVQRRQMPMPQADPTNSFDRKWWGDTLKVDTYSQYNEVTSLEFDTTRQRHFRFKVPSSGVIAILFEQFKVAYEYTNEVGFTPPVDTQTYIVGDQVTTQKSESTTDYAFFGWRDLMTQKPPVNSGNEVRPETAFTMPERDVTLSGQWAVAQVKGLVTDGYNTADKYDNLYLKLGDAVAAAADGQTVQLMVDVKEDIKIDKRITYDSKFAGLAESVNDDENNINGTVILAADANDAGKTANVILHNHLRAVTVGIEAHSFGNKAQIDYNGGAVPNKTKEIRATKAYFDLTLPTGDPAYAWYPINLPFAAKVANVTTAAGKVLTHPEEFGIAEYSGQRRAEKGIGNTPASAYNDWLYIAPPTVTRDLTVNSPFIGDDQVMKAHTAYMVNNRSTGLPLRFYAENGTFSGSDQSTVTNHTGGNGATHNGWNYVAQPLGINATIDLLQGEIIQVSDNTFSSDKPGINKQEKSYVAKTVGIDNIVIAPYTNFYYQTDGTVLTIGFAKSTDAVTTKSVGYASTQVPSRYELCLTDSTQYDVLFVSATADSAAHRYRIGRDVMKMGTPLPQSLRLSSKKNDSELCAIDAPLCHNKADIPLLLNLPQKKEYRLVVNQYAEDGSTLWLLENNTPVCNLSEVGTYTLNATRTAQNNYSLRLLNDMADGNETIQIYGQQGAIIIEGTESYADYAVMSIAGIVVTQGKTSDYRTRVPVNTGGIYVVSVSGKHQKVIVKE